MAVLDAATELGITPELLRSLDRLTLPSRRPILGAVAGQRRSPRPGSSLEFADFRSYVPGDDVRRIDWNACARLDRLVLRLYAGEEDVCVTCWVDCSTSMDWGRPSKSHCARGLAGALAYVALCSEDRAAVAGFTGDAATRSGALRGRRSASRLWSMLATMPTGGQTEYGAVARNARRAPRGISVILSDFLTESSPASAVATLREARHDVLLVQVLAPDEIDPTVRGDLRLRDAETGAHVEITAGAAVLAAYRAELHAHTERLRTTARAHGAGFVQVRCDTPLRTLMLGDLRSAGVLR
jgi:uncharacterized protein (DUF58 family)